MIFSVFFSPLRGYQSPIVKVDHYGEMSKRKSAIADRGNVSLPDLQELREESGRRLRIVRDMLGVRQKEVADALGVSSSRLSENEAGSKAIGLDLLFALRIHYNVNPLYIISGEGPPLLNPIGQTDDATQLVSSLLSALDAVKRYSIQTASIVPNVSNVAAVDEHREIYNLTSDELRRLLHFALKSPEKTGEP